MATVTTKSKRKSRKRKYGEMMKETKQIKKMEKNDTNEKELSVEAPLQLSQSSQISEISEISIPSPSKHDASLDIDDIECDGLLLKSQKASLDELNYLIKGIECTQQQQPQQQHGHDKETLFIRMRNLIKFCFWLKQEKNELIIRGGNFIPMILNKLRILSRIYHNENSIICIIICFLFILLSNSENIYSFTDVSVNILIRFIRNQTKINNIIYSLKQYKNARKSRRHNNTAHKTQKNSKMANDLIKLFANNNQLQQNDDTKIIDNTIGYLSSFLLIEIIIFCIKNANEKGKKNNYCHQIMQYVHHSAVIYKISCIVQINCISLSSNNNNINGLTDVHLNEFILLELITRNLSTKKQLNKTEKEGLLKILDCIGCGLRYIHQIVNKKRNSSNNNRLASATPMSGDMDMDANERDSDDVDMIQDKDNCIGIHPLLLIRTERLLILILKLLTNITNERNVSLKPNTIHSIFYLLSYYNNIVGHIDGLSNVKDTDNINNYQIICLILGCFINCCERNKNFRNSFNKNKINGMNCIDFLIEMLIKTRKLINQIEIKKEKENETDDDDAKGNDAMEEEENDKLFKAYTEYKVISYYVSLLLGFLLQNNNNFKYIASKLNELSLILLCLEQFLEFQNKLQRNPNSNHTVTIISKIMQIVQIRNQTLNQLKSNKNNNNDVQ